MLWHHNSYDIKPKMLGKLCDLEKKKKTVTILLLPLHRIGLLEQIGTIQRTHYFKY